jgi:anti-sigma regulatory factor (Ser/Thr protein kinase)
MTATNPPTSLHYVMASRLTEVDGACRELRALLEAHGLTPVGFPVELATRECLCNAVVHGNRGRADARVTLALRIGRRWIRVEVADEGSGFPWRRASRMPPGIRRQSGRGLAICALYAARMAFSRSGNRITLWIAKRKGDRHARVCD